MQLDRRLARKGRQLSSLVRRALTYSFIIISIVGFGYGYYSDLFRVEGVVCVQDEQDCWPSLWLDLTGKVEGQSLFVFSATRLEDQTLESYPELSSVSVKRLWPRMIFFKIITKKPLIRICLPKSAAETVQPTNCQIYAADGTVLTQAHLDGLPQVRATEVKQSSFGPIFRLYEAFGAAGIIVGEGVLVEEGRAIEVGVTGRKVTFSLEKEVFSQVDSLQDILSRSKMNSKPVFEVDFRYEKPVVRFVEINDAQN
ncbi:hypothetical protein MUP65_00885 [Patescibacteria group bacterium]|nr:hypothetical protein [Patescibacteria group bacterium]